MNVGPTRRRLLLALAGATLGAAGTTRVQAHEFPEPGFTIIHPWVPEAPKGTKRLVVSMRIIQISADDRLLAARTPVGAALELRQSGWQRPFQVMHAVSVQSAASTARAASAPLAANTPSATTEPPPGILLRRGHDLNFTPFGPHLVLHEVNTDLHYGFEYPLTLRFEKAGEVEAALIIGTH